MYIRCVVALALATSAILTNSATAQEPPASQKTATAEPAPQATATQPAPTALPEPTPQDPLALALQQRLAATPTTSDDKAREDLAALATFYAKRTYAPLWVTATGLTAKADAAIAEIKKADDWGLKASDFTLPQPVAGNADAAALAETEVTLSAAVLKYARYARGGRIPDPSTELSSYLDRKPQLLDPQDVMGKIATSDTPDAVLRGFNPQQPQFEKLRQKLLALRKSGPAQEAVRMPDGPLLKPGTSHPDVAILRKRLKVGPPAATQEGKPVDETFYDEKLQEAVKAFQTEKGLAADGLVGRGTRAALNDFEVLTPEKLLANMEEWRWMPEDMGDFYVWVNIPEFKVRVVKNGKVIHSERVIVGKVDKETPVFSENMKMIVFRPRWNVPNSIKVRELWPSLARGSGYFERQGLRLSHNGRPVDPESVDWSSTDIRRFDIYQPAGAGNALGNIKFAFPNKHDVYMHDTPTKGLFNEAIRTFSHGCMRVRNPQRMAEILLAEDKGWDAAKIADLIAHGPENNEVQIDRKIPVHITYFTAWVDDKGETQMARDVYGHEKRITLALEGKWDQIVVGPNHLAPVKIDPELRASIQQSGSVFNSVGDMVQSILGGGF